MRILIGVIAKNNKMYYNLRCHTNGNGALFVSSADVFNNIFYWVKHPVLSDIRPAVRVTTSADSAGCFVMSKQCEICGKPVKGDAIRFCSRECFGKSIRGRGTKSKYALIEWSKNNQPWNYSDVGKGLTCLQCGNTFDTNPHKVRQGKAKYCSLDCYNKARHNPNRKRAIKQRQTDKYKEWKRAVLERDNFTCQRCGMSAYDGANLAAHHIKSFKDYPELRTKLSNGETLCRNCHHKAHYGYSLKYGKCIDCGNKCSQRAKRCRVCDNKRRRALSVEKKTQWMAIKKEYLFGKSLREVGAMFGIGHKSVLYILKRLGVPRRKTWGRKANDV